MIASEFRRQIDAENLANTLEVRRWSEIQHKLVKRILSETLWLRGELQEPYTAESQVDFVATELSGDTPVRVVAVYSCKASLRERFQQDLYWAEKFRGRGIRFCFVTLDNDGVLLRAVATGKLHSKQAKMAAALYDRIYLLTDEPIQYFTRVFRTVDALVEDLKQWLQAG
ncbi:MAG: BsaWI family type II restriction enzyme [Fimbriimonadales bacterium]|nr:BsaWI family type II restriction enzyme [Fimbriimonadales bacterium]